MWVLCWQRSTHAPFAQRRTRGSRNKLHRCAYSGCDKTFYMRHTLLRHQTKKHGRSPRMRWQFPALDAIHTLLAPTGTHASLPTLEAAGSAAWRDSGELTRADVIDVTSRRQITADADVAQSARCDVTSYARWRRSSVVTSDTTPWRQSSDTTWRQTPRRDVRHHVTRPRLHT